MYYFNMFQLLKYSFFIMVKLYSYWIRRVGVDVLSVNGVSRRTNNNLESFHNFLRHKFSIAHPNLWVFLGKC